MVTPIAKPPLPFFPTYRFDPFHRVFNLWMYEFDRTYFIQ